MNVPVVLDRHNLIVLLRCIHEAIASGGEDQYLFIYPGDVQTPFALVSKTDYDALAQPQKKEPPMP